MTFSELVCWKLSQALKVEILAFTDRGPAAQDFKYRDQIRDSAASAPRNIAEGFGHFGAREFARFLGYARASLMETASSLVDGHDRKYLDTQQYSRLMNLTRAALKATTGLLRQKRRQADEPKSRQLPPARLPPREFSITVDELIVRRKRRAASRRPPSSE